MLAVDDDDTEERLGRVLKTIANDVNRDIVMVEDYPSKNENGKNGSPRYDDTGGDRGGRSQSCCT